MTGYVIDASVAVKWLVTEAFSDQAASLLDSKLTLIAPELLFAEAANALDAADERGAMLRPDPRRLLLGRAVGQKAGQLFVEGAFDVCQVLARQRRCPHDEQTAELA